MHMADALLSPAVGLTMWAVSAASVGVSASKIQRQELSEKRLPVMAVTGAFVFAAQMINFTIPPRAPAGTSAAEFCSPACWGDSPRCLR